MSRRNRFSLVLVLACFSFLILQTSDSKAVDPVEYEDLYPGVGNCDDCPPSDDEGGDPEEILIRSRPAPPVEDGFGILGGRDSSSAWLIHLVDLVRALR